MADQRRRVTIRDIAETLDVSAATVSTALTGRRQRVFVSDETRRRVLAAAETMGYPFERLRARPQRLRRIAVFFPAGPNTVYHTTALQLCQVLGQRDCQVLIHVADDYAQVGETASRLYRNHDVDGVILIGSATQYQSQALERLPCVVVGEMPDGQATSQVVVDNEQGGRLIAEHLWSLGHRRVGFVCCRANPLPAARRLRGLRRAWRAAGGEFGPDRVLKTRTDLADELAEKLPAFVRGTGLSRGALSAVVFWNDWTAVTGLKALRASGLRVPEDVSVVGFDDTPIAELTNPSLTTVRVPFADLGTTAAELLEERLNTPDGGRKRRVLPAQLVARESTTRVG